MSTQKPGNNNRVLLQYAGLGAQILVSLALAVYGGLKLDEKFQFSFPILVWALPLLVLVGLIYKMIRDTSRKNDNS